MNSRVPLLAMVPRLETASSAERPMPLSVMVIVFAAASKATRTSSSVLPSYNSGLSRASKRSLSQASEAFEISSRRKICLTSAWKERVCLSIGVLFGSWLKVPAAAAGVRHLEPGRRFSSVRLLESAAVRTVTATRYVTPLREGGSLPAVIEADDDGLYVLKFCGAGQGVRALVAELVAGEIARACGLPVPEIVFAELHADLARTEPDPEIQDLIRASAELADGRQASGSNATEPGR